MNNEYNRKLIHKTIMKEMFKLNFRRHRLVEMKNVIENAFQFPIIIQPKWLVKFLKWLISQWVINITVIGIHQKDK